MGNYHMRRHDRQIADKKELGSVLKNGKYTVIAMCRNNEPYVVTLSYGYDAEQNSLYFHSAKEGLKLDFIANNPEVCATVIEDGGYVMNECAHEYRSVVLRGRMSVVDALEEKKHGMEILLMQLEETPSFVRESSLKNNNVYDRLSILKMEISEMTGKKGR